METNRTLDNIETLLDSMGYPVERDGERVIFLMLPGIDPELEPPAIGETFLASSLGLNPPDDADYLQSSIMFLQGVPIERINVLREFAARLSRMLTGGYFGVCDSQDGTCFLEYVFDLPLLNSLSDDQKMRMFEITLDMAEAFITLSREAFKKVASGEMTPDEAIDHLNGEQ